MKILRNIFNKIRRDNSGQALIELALTLPLLAALLLGATELGQMAYAAIEVSNAAKAAAAYAALNGGAYLSTTTSGLDEAGMLTAAQADAGELGNKVSFVSGTPTVACKCSGAGTASCTPGSVPSGCNPPISNLLVTVTVKTKTSYNPMIVIPGWSRGSITLYGYAQQEVLPL